MNEIKAAADYIKSRGVEKPVVGIVLGTGLGNLALQIDAEQTIEYSDIPNFPVSTILSHCLQA